MPFKIWVQQTTFNIDWSFSSTGIGLGTLTIYVNSSPVVSVAATENGSFSVNVGDTIDISADNTSFGNTVAASITSIDNGTTVCSTSDCQLNSVFVSCGSYTVTGDGSITATAGDC